MRIAGAWFVIGGVVVLAIVAWVVTETRPLELASEENIFLAVLERLGVLFVIAIFVERAVEVYISTRRGIGRAALDRKVSEAKSTDAKRSAEDALTEYKAETRREAFLFALFLGLIIALAGVRLIQLLVGDTSSLGGFQETLLGTIDVLIVAGLLAGGAEPIHQILSTITDFFAETRKRMESTSGGS